VYVVYETLVLADVASESDTAAVRAEIVAVDDDDDDDEASKQKKWSQLMKQCK